METEEIVELGIIALIVAGIGFILYEAFGFFKDSGATSAIGNVADAVTAPVATASDTLFGKGAGIPGSNSNEFYTGIDNFFHTGSIYGDQGVQ